MRKPHTLQFVLGLLIILVSACGGSDELSIPTDLMQPLALSSRLVFIDKTLHNAYLLEVTEKEIEPATTAVAIPPQPLVVQKRNGADEVLILCAGQQDSEGKEETEAALAVLNSNGKVRSYYIEKGFNTLVQSEDGRYVFIFFSAHAENALEATGFPTMKQKVVFIDLAKNPSAKDVNPSLILSNHVSNLPTGVTFSPEMTIAGKQRRLAVIHSTALVWLVDLSTPDSPPVTIEPDVGVQFNFEQVLFDEKKPLMYLRGSLNDSINVVDLEGNIDNAPENGLMPKPVLKEPRLVGQGPSDMALYTISGQSYLLVVSNASTQATIINTNSSAIATVPLTSPANRILMFSTTPKTDGGSVPQALLYNQSQGYDYTAVTFLDLASLDLAGTDRVKAESVAAVTLDSAFNQLAVLSGKNFILLTHATNKQTSILDLDKRYIFPIETSSRMNVITDSRVNKLWFAPPMEEQSSNRLGYLDVDTFVSEDVRLDEIIQHVLLVGTGDKARIAVVHPSSIGYVTILDAKSPSRESAVSVEGFFMSEIMD